MQVRGKKNLVVSKDLAGPVSLFVKFSVLQDYGVDRVFLLENGNLDNSQRNVVFLVHAEKVAQVAAVAGESFSFNVIHHGIYLLDDGFVFQTLVVYYTSP